MPRSIVTISCLNCGQEKNVAKSEVKRGYGKYCSRKCSAEHSNIAFFKEKNKPNVECAYCHKPFYKSASKLALSKSGFHFCCREHKDYAQRIDGVEGYGPDHYGDGTRAYRKKAIRDFGAICNRCGYDDHPAAIVVHHKDRDRSNNESSNLEVLCANCHAIEHWSTD